MTSQLSVFTETQGRVYSLDGGGHIVTCEVCRAHAQVVNVSGTELQHALATFSKFGSLLVYFSVGGSAFRPQTQLSISQ
jgi:hypothetical protein